MQTRRWYTGARVIRQPNTRTGKHEYINVSLPNAAVSRRQANVPITRDNEFLADVITGLLYEIQRLENDRPPEPGQFRTKFNNKPYDRRNRQ